MFIFAVKNLARKGLKYNVNHSVSYPGALPLQSRYHQSCPAHQSPVVADAWKRVSLFFCVDHVPLEKNKIKVIQENIAFHR